ncbi:MAG: pyridoxamine kinase [Clostridiaceae bacterium]
MDKPIKRVAAINDLSGFGRASLLSIIPVLSTMGVQVCPVPTAILSTHTGDFEDYSFVDLTDSMEDYFMHWKKLNIEFDCIYTGFLGSTKQINLISKFLDLFSNEKTLKVIDPVMADQGKLYSTMDNNMIISMKKLVKKADIITPNFTEACFLLGKPYKNNIEHEEIKEYLIKLSNMGPDIVIITSVPENTNNNSTSVIAYDKSHNAFWKTSCTFIPAYYPGTGDIFTSVVIGSLLQGDSLPIALDRAVQFIYGGIKASFGFDYPKREGILLEKVLGNLNLPVLLSSYEIFE